MTKKKRSEPRPASKARKAGERDRTRLAGRDSRSSNLTAAYKVNPSIENYLQIRRAYPDVEIEVSVIGGGDQLDFMEPDFTRFGIDLTLVRPILDADHAAISELALILLEKIAARDRKLKNGGTHLTRRGEAIPDKLVDWIIACSLDSLSWKNDLRIPRDLIVLIRKRLCGSDPAYERASRADEMRRSAEVFGGQILAEGRHPSFRAVARLLGVDASTVKRWFPGGDFVERAKLFVPLFDEKLGPTRLKEIEQSLQARAKERKR